MIFVLQYDRDAGQITAEQVFADNDAEGARAARLRADLAALGNPNLEIVTLQAEDRDALLRTHARYFRSIRELAQELVPKR